MSILKNLISILNTVIKKKNIILFNSYPDYSDNSLALYKYILDERRDILQGYNLIWAKENDSNVPNYLKKYHIISVNKKSVKGIFIFLRSKYVITTHGYFSNVKSGNGQIQINLWHGCGYKTIPEKEHHYIGDKLVVTSDFYRDVSSKIFEMSKDDVLPLGYPRNDWLFKKGNLEKIISNKSMYEKVLVWLPTYRKSETGYISTDGDEKSFCIGNLTDYEFKKLDSFLCTKNYLLVIKPHPMDAQKLNLQEMSNICVIDNSKLNLAGLNLYEILADTDLLISDYSSVVIDYLLLRKPIIMALSDMKEYRENRGFIFDNVLEHFPGPVASNMDQLIDNISKIENIDLQWKQKREELLAKFQNYTDDHNCERVCNYLSLEMIKNKIK